MKIVILLGTRPEIIKMSEVIKELDRFYDVTLVHTGQNYSRELNEVFFEDLGLRTPDIILPYQAKTPIEGIAQMMTGVDKVLLKERFEACLIFGDTNSCISALSAKRRHIPVVHFEAGNRSFDDRIPEEVNRRIIDSFSDVNLCLSDYARNYLINEGKDPRLTINIGSPIPELLLRNKENIGESGILTELGLKKGGYFLLSTHREENVDGHLGSILRNINALSQYYKVPTVVTVHPRLKKNLDNQDYDNLIFRTAFGLKDYWSLETNSLCVISDSGTLTEESNVLGFAAVNMRQSHERPEGDAVGLLSLVGRNYEALKIAVEIAIEHNKNRNLNYVKIQDYEDNIYSKKIARLLPGLIDMVNRVVYNKAPDQ